ncbi:MAG: aldo/keto reductase [Solimonas sp.]
MQYQTLGRTGLRVSRLVFGTATFGGVGALAAWGTTGLDEGRRLVDMAIDAGVNMIDTANVYSFGRSEEMVGEILVGRREHVLIATKVRLPMSDHENDEGLSRHHIIRQCEASLKRLRTDHIDLYQMHEWDGLTAIEETLAAFDDLVRSGKVRYVGVSNFAGWQLQKTMHIAKTEGFPRPVAHQIYYSLEARDAELELIPASIDQDIGNLVWSPLSGGLLTGKYRREDPQGSDGRYGSDPVGPPIRSWEKLHDKVDVVKAIADEHGLSPAEVALAWVLARPGITGLVIGARTEEQLRVNLRAINVTLSNEELARLDAVSRPDLPYPFWHQQRTIAKRLSAADRSLLASYL